MERMWKTMEANEAKVNLTYGGQNGELPDAVAYDAADGDVRAWAAEAIRTGGVPNIPADPDVDLSGYMIERYPATDATPYNRIFVRPKTAFGDVQ